MLDPPPRDFTAAIGLDATKIAAAVARGRPGTAMQPFSNILSRQEITDVAAFVAERFVGCQDPNTTYHTRANGWPEHEARYAAAYPFVDGTATIDEPAEVWPPDRQAGRALFLSSCISCHEGRMAAEQPLGLSASVEPEAQQAVGHVDDYEVRTIHDYPPVIADLTAEETEGRDFYTAACAQCHAADGTGLNWVGRFLQPPPPDFTTLEFARAFQLSEFAAWTLDPPLDISMPAFARVLNESDVAAIAAYVRRAFVADAN
jgi:cytochrome c oxidase cbb3-type subunit 3